MVIYYAVSPQKPEEILQFKFLDEYILKLYHGEIEFLSEEQQKKLSLPDDYLYHLRKSISKYRDRIPMYYVFYNHIYLIYQENVYERLLYNNYRFIDEQFYHDLLRVKNKNKEEEENVRILSHYDFRELERTYDRVFYKSFILYNHITHCYRPSFHQYLMEIEPYYTAQELYYLGYDWGLIKKEDQINKIDLEKLCQNISQFDIPYQILLDHQIYIYDCKAIGLVKHYSLFGSYYFNLYLRKFQSCENNTQMVKITRNLDLENQITLMINLIKGAPAFIKDFTVYRFVEDDFYFAKLKPGQFYTDPSFMSTTRNPFYYYKQNYSFGNILIKIRLPENIQGMALCIESYSNFPKEQEIILPPTTVLQLVKIWEEDQIDNYQHLMNKRVKRKYEFIWKGNSYYQIQDKISLKMLYGFAPKIPILRLMEIVYSGDFVKIPIESRLSHLENKYIRNENSQFISIINEKEYIFTLESYNASTVYRPFFYYPAKDGLMITSTNPQYGNINILIELGLDLHVNYYFKYSVTDSQEVINLDTVAWIEWLVALTYLVGSRKFIIYSNYEINYNKNDLIEQKHVKTKYTYSSDIYQYLKEGKKMFSQFTDIVTGYDYGRLDSLKNMNVADHITPSDKSEIYRVAVNFSITKMDQLYLFLSQNFPNLLKDYEEKLKQIFPAELNPFLHINYSLHAWTYLYSKNIITMVPDDAEFQCYRSFHTLIKEKKIRKFRNRLRFYLDKL